jgi:hypothetical protein
MENAPGCDRELIIAVFAVKDFGAVDEPHNRPLAAWAFGIVGPAKTFQKLPAKIIVGEGVAKLDDGHRRPLHG